MALTQEQIQTIDYQLRSHLHETKWPYQELFLAEITDHYIDSIMARMSEGEPFELALKNTYDGFGQGKGLKSLEINYWRNCRLKLFRQMASYFEIPRLFISLPLIVLFFAAKTNGVSMLTKFLAGWTSYLPSLSTFQLSFYCVHLAALFFSRRPPQTEPLQQFLQRTATSITRITNWVFFGFMVEMFSNPLMVGKASPYLATFFYVFGVIFHLSRLALEQPNALAKPLTR